MEDHEVRQKRVLIIGASILQLPAIIKAKEMNCRVGVVDINPNAVGISYADVFFCVSTIDIEGVVSTAKEFEPDGIVTLATDMPMRAIAKACEECGLPGISYETAIRATDKGEMIKTFEKHGVEHPWYYIIKDENDFEQIKESLSFPCIMKPTDNAGSRGVVLCKDYNELLLQYNYSLEESRSGNVIIEEYLEGDEFSVEIIAVDGEPHVLQVTDKLTTGAPHFVEMGHSQPTKQSSKNRNKIENLACRAVKAIGINNGPAHVEIILTNNGPKMVELGARLGGDCITTHLVPLSTGIDMVKATIQIACGEKVDLLPKYEKGAAIRYFNNKAGLIKSIEGVEKAKEINGVKEISIVHEAGELSRGILSSTDRLGFVITQGNDANEAIDICEHALSTVRIVVTEENKQYDIIELQKLDESHVDIIFSWIQNDELRKMTGTRDKPSRLKHENWFKKKISDKENVYRIIYYNNIPVGFTGTNNIDRCNNNAEVFIYIGEERFRGKGIAKKSLMMLIDYLRSEYLIHKVYAKIFPYNTTSIFLFDKCGFQLEGKMIEQRYISEEDRYIDLLLYGRLLL